MNRGMLKAYGESSFCVGCHYPDRSNILIKTLQLACHDIKNGIQPKTNKTLARYYYDIALEEIKND